MVMSQSVAIRERPFRCARLVVPARCAGVVRRLVVLLARRALRDRVLGVIPIEARCAGVILWRCGAVMRAAGQPQWPARPTRRSSRPLRARDRWYFEGIARRLRRLNGNPFGGTQECYRTIYGQRPSTSSQRTIQSMDSLAIAYSCCVMYNEKG
jgi:hypothetical protein